MSKQQTTSLVLIPSGAIPRFEGQLIPFLQARGIFSKKGGDVRAWLANWLGSETGFFWGAMTKHPEEGGVYLVHPSERGGDESSGFSAKIRVGDCWTTIRSPQRFPDSFYVKVRKVDKGKVEAEHCQAPESESAYASRFRVFHTAHGVTGQLEAFAGTNALQLVNVLPNERMPMDDLSQLPERISVRKDSFPLKSVLFATGQEKDSSVYRFACVCDNCHGNTTLQCEKCGGTGTLLCKRCGGTGHVPCKKCNGEGTFTLPAKDVTCKKCGGSGEYSRNGEYVGECNRCGGTGKVHFDEHDVNCSACDGTGQWECISCKGDGTIVCHQCKGNGKFDCWVCGGQGTLRVLLDYKTNRFYRKYKEETTWLAPDEVFLFNETDNARVFLSGRWPDLLRATERQRRKADEMQRRSERIVKDGKTIDSCLERVLRLSPTAVKPFEIRDPVAASGRKTKGRVSYEFKVCGKPPWLAKANPADENSTEQGGTIGPFRNDTPVTLEGISVPEGKGIVYEGCDTDGRRLTFSFPIEVDVASLEGRKLEVRPDVIPPPERREKERLGFWLENTKAPIYRGIVEGVEEKCADIPSFFNGRISKFPTQIDAIRQGLSDAPVLLLKGPPGTGKTTVIVELIRQAVRQGMRVLLTSQTHQAVDNVLERLHKFRESGEDRNVRMAVYAASETKLSDLGRQYMAGGEEEEFREIRNRAEKSLASLESSCSRNRTIRALLSEGTATASALQSRLIRRDNDLRSEEASRDADLEEIARRCAEETATENQLFEKIESQNRTRQTSVQNEIGRCARDIQKLENERDWFDRQAKGRSSMSDFAKNTRLGGFLRDVTDAALKGIDHVAGTHLDPVRARMAWNETNQKLNDVWEAKRSQEVKLAEAISEQKRQAVAHTTALRVVEERKENEQTARRTAAEETFQSIRIAAAEETAPLHAAQNQRIIDLVSAGGESESRGLDAESSPEEWGKDIASLDNEFELLEKRRQFVLSWCGELRNTPQSVTHFLNAQTNVFFATCVGMGSWRALTDGTYEMRDESAGESGRTIFDLAIVDEAGHATFAETVVPLCSAKKAILIGDDKQLPPMLGEDLDCHQHMEERCPSCAVGADGPQCWFEYSMFQYLWENDRVFKLPRLMLDTQFRMHPDIADFISQAFYEGELKNGVSAEERRFSFGSFRNPVCLLSTSNQKNRFEKWQGTSCCNPLEVEYVKGVVEELLSSLNEGTVEGLLGVPLSLAVITPYAAQETLLKQSLAPCFQSTDRFSFSSRDIASVDRFQGDERDIVIASFVRSPDTQNGKRLRRLTFVHDLKRMNVAFSRARRMLILVGDIKALESAPGNEAGRAAFAHFHAHVTERGREILVWERKAR